MTKELRKSCISFRDLGSSRKIRKIVLGSTKSKADLGINFDFFFRK